MSVLIVTSLGDIVVDLHADRCPLTTKNFLKLCKMKYYNGCLFHKVEKDFLAQTGDRTGTGTGGESVYKCLYGEQARFFDDEIHPDLKHKKIGTVAMASAGKNGNASQFYFTLREDLDYLDGKHTVFGIVEEQEGLDTLTKINEAFVDEKGRPYKNIRIKHTYILDDPFPDPPQLVEFIPEKSPEGKPDVEIAEERLEDNWVPLDETLGVAELEELLREREAHTNAAILESIGDIPDADMKPPENVLFVCKLNPVTQDEDLHTIFSRFGTVVSADIIRDYKTGDSLCYAFIEFEVKESCELAYIKMDNTLIDDRRIHVDFSQSVAKLWGQYRHGKRSAGGGCFKCGATDHIAKDCNEGSNKKDKQSNYVLKSGGDTQRGGGHKNYDMVFDEDEPGRPQKRSNETGTAKRHKTDTLNSEEFRQKSSSGQLSDSRPYRSASSHGNTTHNEQDFDERRSKYHERGRNDKDSDNRRDCGGMNGDKKDRYEHMGSRRERDGEEYLRNKERGKESKSREYEERKPDRYSEHRESSRHHHSDRHERYPDEPRKRSSETDRKKYESDRNTVDQDKEEQRYRSKHGEDIEAKEKRHRHEHRR